MVDLEHIRRRDECHQKLVAGKFNAGPRTKPSSIRTGQSVLLRNHIHSSKFNPKFSPDIYLVLNREGHATFLVRHQATHAVFIRHEDDLQVVTTPHQPLPPTSTQFSFPLWLDDQDKSGSLHSNMGMLPTTPTSSTGGLGSTQFQLPSKYIRVFMDPNFTINIII